MRAVALTLSIALFGGCFNNPQHRTLAKVGEGVAIVAGIALLAFANTSADCSEGGLGSMPNEDCENRASLISSVGLGLILVGMVGFVVTVSTSPDDDATTAPVTSPKADGTKPAEPAPPPTADPTPAPAPAPTPDAPPATP